MNQLRRLVAEQAEATQRFESHSQQFVSRQQEEYAYKQHSQFQQFDGALAELRNPAQSLQQRLPSRMQCRLRRRRFML